MVSSTAADPFFFTNPDGRMATASRDWTTFANSLTNGAMIPGYPNQGNHEWHHSVERCGAAFHRRR
jgi:hypothetical protein